MKQKLFSQTIFIAKSLLWSLLLYITTMMIINWEDITKKKTGGMPLVNYDQQEQPVPVKVTDNAPDVAFSVTRPVTALAQKITQALEVLY